MGEMYVYKMLPQLCSNDNFCYKNHRASLQYRLGHQNWQQDEQ